MLMFPQTSSSSSCAISELPSSRNRLDSSAGISSAAASRSAGLPERTRFRCASISSRIVKLPTALVIQASFQNRPDDFILCHFYEMESQPRERVLRPVVRVALRGRQDAGSADQGGTQPQAEGKQRAMMHGRLKQVLSTQCSLTPRSLDQQI